MERQKSAEGTVGAPLPLPSPSESHLDAAALVADLVWGTPWDEHTLVLVLLKVPGVNLGGGADDTIITTSTERVTRGDCTFCSVFIGSKSIKRWTAIQDELHLTDKMQSGWSMSLVLDMPPLRLIDGKAGLKPMQTCNVANAESF